MRRILCGCLAVLLIFTSVRALSSRQERAITGENITDISTGDSEDRPVPKQKLPFTDIPIDSSFYDAVAWAVQQEITKGTSETTFSPSNPCTKSHILTFMWRMEGGNLYPNVASPFSDQSAEGDFGQAAIWAYRNGLETGEKSGQKRMYSGGEVCSRRMAVIYLWKLAGAPDVDFDISSQFTDLPAPITTASRELGYAVAWAFLHGITKGTSATKFSPDKNCTRWQIVTFLYRYREYAESNSI